MAPQPSTSTTFVDASAKCDMIARWIADAVAAGYHLPDAPDYAKANLETYRARFIAARNELNAARDAHFGTEAVA